MILSISNFKGDVPINECFIHYIMLGLFLLYLGYFLFTWFFLSKYKFSLTNIIISSAFIVGSIVTILFSKCLLCFIVSTLNLILYVSSLLMYIFLSRILILSDDDLSLMDSYKRIEENDKAFIISKEQVKELLENKYKEEILVKHTGIKFLFNFFPLKDKYYISKNDQLIYLGFMLETKSNKSFFVLKGNKLVRKYIEIYHTGVNRSLYPLSLRNSFISILLDESYSSQEEVIDMFDVFYINNLPVELPICQSCSMPIGKKEHGTNEDGSLSDDYCIYCYENGKFTSDEPMEVLIDEWANYRPKKMSKEEMIDKLKETLPTLKRWKK